MGPDENTAKLVSDRRAMIAGMAPLLDRDTYVFCSIQPSQLTDDLLRAALAMFREREGISLILPLDRLQSTGLDIAAQPMARISLEVYSSLEGVGLTAAVSGALAEQGIACNMVAAFHHDHVFVPRDKACDAMNILLKLQKSAAQEAD